MTYLDNGTVVTDAEALEDNTALSAQGYTIRHIETWNDRNQTRIVWDCPQIGETDIPY